MKYNLASLTKTKEASNLFMFVELSKCYKLETMLNLEIYLDFNR